MWDMTLCDAVINISFCPTHPLLLMGPLQELAKSARKGAYLLVYLKEQWKI